MDKWWKKLASHYPFLRVWKRKAKTITLPGFDGIPVYEVYRFFLKEIRANSLTVRSQSIAFSFFLAFFAALTFVFTVIPYIPYFKNIDISILNFLRQVLPNNDTYNFTRAYIEPLISDLAHKKRQGLLTGSILLTLFLASNGVIAMMTSFDKSYAHYQKRNALQSRLVAFKITFLLVLLFIFSIALIILGQSMFFLVMHWMKLHGRYTHLVFDVIRYILIVLMFFVGISLIYYYGPATKKKYRSDFHRAVTVATLLSILVSVVFSYYVTNFNRLNVIFGSIGTIMLLLIWLNINAFVLLIGYEINASIHYNRTLRTRELEVKEAEI